MIQSPARGQGHAAVSKKVVNEPVWSVISDGDRLNTPVPDGMGLDSIHVVARSVIANLQAEGHYFVKLDSVIIDSLQIPFSVTLYVNRGPLVRIGEIEIEGVDLLEEEEITRSLTTRSGRVLDNETLSHDLDELVRLYESKGYPLAQVRVDDIALRSKDEPLLDVRLVVDEGYQPRLNKIELEGAKRTRSVLAARLADLQMGEVFQSYNPVEIQQLLLDSGLFTQVALPELYVGPDSGAVVRVRVKEAAPGSFDLVLGYQPASGTSSGGLIGNGQLELRNLFGGGRIFSLRLHRLPGQVSRLQARITDPYFLGLPLRVEGRFEGLQEHSEYGKQGYTGEAGYRLGKWVEVRGSLSKEVTRPGPSGITLVDGKQLVPRADAFFAGIGIHLMRQDNPVNPSKGFQVEFLFEEGRKDQELRRLITEVDTTLERQVLQQSRIKARVRSFFPTFGRQVLVAGFEGAVLTSEAYDQSDLFRFGGATSLRGYDEDRFYGRIVARGLLEYRYRLDPRSFGFVFFDLGYVDQPSFSNLDSMQGFFPGYGFGVQYDTNIGLVNLSYALSSEDKNPVNGRVHVGLTFGI